LLHRRSNTAVPHASPSHACYAVGGAMQHPGGTGWHATRAARCSPWRPAHRPAPCALRTTDGRARVARYTRHRSASSRRPTKGRPQWLPPQQQQQRRPLRRLRRGWPCWRLGATQPRRRESSALKDVLSSAQTDKGGYAVVLTVPFAKGLCGQPARSQKPKN